VHQQRIEAAVPPVPAGDPVPPQHPDAHPSDPDGRTDRVAGVGLGENPDMRTAPDAPAEEAADRGGRRGEAELPDAREAAC